MSVTVNLLETMLLLVQVFFFFFNNEAHDVPVSASLNHFFRSILEREELQSIHWTTTAVPPPLPLICLCVCFMLFLLFFSLSLLDG